MVSGREQLIGSTGVMLDDSDVEGWARVHSEQWRVRAQVPLKRGQEVRVTGPRRARPHRRPASSKGASRCSPCSRSGSCSLILLALVLTSFRVLREYERGVVFMLGRFWRVKGPGLVILIPIVQQMVRIDLRTVVFDVPPQDVITRDNVSVKVNAVVYFRVVDPEKAVIQVERYLEATSQLAQTTLRAVLGKHELDALLAERERLNLDIQKVLDSQTDAWGIKVSNVEIKHVDLNESMIRAIARQAEAERERRAKIIHAEGELQASEKLLQAAQMLARAPQAMQLRYLQTLGNIAGDKSTTIVFPLPMELLSMLQAERVILRIPGASIPRGALLPRAEARSDSARAPRRKDRRRNACSRPGSSPRSTAAPEARDGDRRRAVACGTSSDRVERALEIALEVRDVLDADRQPHEVVADAELRPLIRRNRGVRHDRRMLDQALDAAQALGEREELAALEEALRPGEVGRKVERDHAAEAAHLARGERVLRMRRQARIAHAQPPSGCASSHCASAQRIRAMPLHPQRERLQVRAARGSCRTDRRCRRRRSAGTRAARRPVPGAARRRRSPRRR